MDASQIDRLEETLRRIEEEVRAAVRRHSALQQVAQAIADELGFTPGFAHDESAHALTSLAGAGDAPVR